MSEHTVTFGPIFKVHCESGEHSNKYGASEMSQLASVSSCLRGVWMSAIRLPVKCRLISNICLLPPSPPGQNVD